MDTQSPIAPLRSRHHFDSSRVHPQLDTITSTVFLKANLLIPPVMFKQINEDGNYMDESRGTSGFFFFDSRNDSAKASYYASLYLSVHISHRTCDLRCLSANLDHKPISNPSVFPLRDDQK